MGYTEEQLKEQGKACNIGSLLFSASGRTRASGNTEGFVKVLADKTTDEVFGRARD
jgi:dihydrolipoamide dehydrogenase